MIATDRLYYTDCYLRRFDAQVAASDGDKVYLDRSAFYPSSGGQPYDLGTIAGIPVTDVIDAGESVAHVLASPLPGGTSTVAGEIDWTRRFDHMQQHTGQHLLSAVLVELFGIHTLSFHLGADYSTIDVEVPSLDQDKLWKAEDRANEIVFENRPVTIEFAPAAGAQGLRKPSERDGDLRIVSIAELDRSACGGTHVRSTAEIGPVAIRRLDKIRGSVRIEFLCGLRAVRRARADYQALAKTARIYSSALDETPGMVAAQAERLQELDKAYRKLAAEANDRQGRELYAATSPGEDGVRKVVRNSRIDDELRAVAQGFVAGSKAVFIALCDEPPSLLVAASKDAGIHAGDLVKRSVTAHGGRGGGSPVLGQGSVPTREALAAIRSAL